jgi:hypothetical protein
MSMGRVYKFFSNVWLISVGVLFAYSLLTVIMTWPVVARLNTHLIGTGDDMWVHYWNNWWVKQVLQQGGNVYYTPLLFHPTGVSLLYHNFAWVNIAIWLVLEPFVGGIAAYNLVHVLHIPLCGVPAGAPFDQVERNCFREWFVFRLLALSDGRCQPSEYDFDRVVTRPDACHAAPL